MFEHRFGQTDTRQLLSFFGYVLILYARNVCAQDIPAMASGRKAALVVCLLAALATLQSVQVRIQFLALNYQIVNLSPLCVIGCAHALRSSRSRTHLAML